MLNKLTNMKNVKDIQIYTIYFPNIKILHYVECYSNDIKLIYFLKNDNHVRAT